MAQPHTTSNSPPVALRLLRTAVGLGGRVMPALTARALSSLFFRPRRRPFRETALPRPDAEGQADNSYLRRWDGGAKAVLLIHGWEGHYTQFETLITCLLNAGYTVISVDPPAHGDAPGSRSHPGHFAQALQDAVKAEGTPFAVVGHSMGAGAALLASRSGLSPSKLVLISSPASFRHVVDGFLDLVGSQGRSRQRFYSLVEGEVGYSLNAIDAEYLAPALDDVSVLIVHDRRDRWVPFDNALRLRAALRHAELHETSGAGHSRILADGEAVAKILDFLHKAPTRWPRKRIRLSTRRIAMSKAEVTYQCHRGNAWITIDNRTASNALSRDVLQQLGGHLDQAEKDPEARAVILTGAGDKTFSAGADIAYLSTASPEEVRAYAYSAIVLTEKIEALGKITVAAINGHALGGGLEIAEACTFRIAVHGAQLGHPEVRIGAIAGFGGTSRLPRLIGRSKAMEMLLTGETVSAHEALATGLINRAVSHHELVAESEKLLANVQAGSPNALKLTRDAVLRAMELPLGAALRLGADHFGFAASNPDFREGTEAFLCKRRPRWCCAGDGDVSSGSRLGSRT